MRRRIGGARAVVAALDAGEPLGHVLILATSGSDAPTRAARAAAERAREAGVPVEEASAREMRRMSGGAEPDEILALLGPPPARDLASLMAAPGLVLLLAGLRYPSNAGFVLRSAEVAGAAGVVIDADWSTATWEEASRVSIRAERFLPVLRARSEAAVAAARRAGRKIVAVETVGRSSPWSVDLCAPTLLVLGSETRGIAEPILAAVDAIVRIPTRGFIPSYNVQAATGILIGEWLRQTAVEDAAVATDGHSPDA